MTRTTHTYAVLEVPYTVYAVVRALLDEAGYQHAFHAGNDGEVIDMHGIALRALPLVEAPKTDPLLLAMAEALQALLRDHGISGLVGLSFAIDKAKGTP